ncbi:MAG: hypothetical protein QXY54_03785 [Nitrososphaerota archaeon]
MVLLLADCAVELIPREIWRHPAVVNYCRKRGKTPGKTLLDSSYHHAAMRGLRDAERRGRPDILHFTILEVLGSPLNKSDKLRTYIHSQAGNLVEVNPSVRLPRNYDRFKSLIEQLLAEKEIRTESGEVLLRVEDGDLRSWRERWGLRSVVLLSETGEPLNRLGGIRELLEGGRPVCYVIGCFPHGDFSGEVKAIADMEVRISDYRLDAWVAASRLLCMLESVLLPGPGGSAG